MTGTDWSAYRAYSCRYCGADCINRRDDPATERQECRRCARVPGLEDDRALGRPVASGLYRRA